MVRKDAKRALENEGTGMFMCDALCALSIHHWATLPTPSIRPHCRRQSPSNVKIDTSRERQATFRNDHIKKATLFSRPIASVTRVRERYGFLYGTDGSAFSCRLPVLTRYSRKREQLQLPWNSVVSYTMRFEYQGVLTNLTSLEFEVYSNDDSDCNPRLQ
jgi:hypothetical protein